MADYWTVRIAPIAMTGQLGFLASWDIAADSGVLAPDVPEAINTAGVVSDYPVLLLRVAERMAAHPYSATVPSVTDHRSLIADSA